MLQLTSVGHGRTNVYFEQVINISLLSCWLLGHRSRRQVDGLSQHDLQLLADCVWVQA